MDLPVCSPSLSPQACTTAATATATISQIASHPRQAVRLPLPVLVHRSRVQSLPRRHPPHTLGTNPPVVHTPLHLHLACPWHQAVIRSSLTGTVLHTGIQVPLLSLTAMASQLTDMRQALPTPAAHTIRTHPSQVVPPVVWEHRCPTVNLDKLQHTVACKQDMSRVACPADTAPPHNTQHPPVGWARDPQVAGAAVATPVATPVVVRHHSAIHLLVDRTRWLPLTVTVALVAAATVTVAIRVLPRRTRRMRHTDSSSSSSGANIPRRVPGPRRGSRAWVACHNSKVVLDLQEGLVTSKAAQLPVEAPLAVLVAATGPTNLRLTHTHQHPTKKRWRENDKSLVS